MRSPKRESLINLAVLAVTLIVCIALCEAVFRARYAHYFYAPQKAILGVQAQLITHPALGFTWKPNINEARGILLENKDVQFENLSTDASGVINCPQAIAARAAGERVDVIGLGDSFMELANHTFHDLFAERGLHYYSLAIHRQAPPQYNLLLREQGLPLKPTWVIYGLFENDFAETLDYEAWRNSGLDWFTFHSGTWCGPSLNVSPWRRFLKHNFKGFWAFGKVLDEKLGRTASSAATAPPHESVDKVAALIQEAQAEAQAQGAHFLLLLIPSKNATLSGPTPESAYYDEVIARLRNLVNALDLRPAFAAAQDPASLYYQQDGHWNRNGIELAGALILQRIQSAPETSSQKQ